MKNKASIDIGSNSVQFLIIDSNKKELFREQYITGLGRGVAENLNFDQQSIDDTKSALRICLDECEKHHVARENIIATATEASRKALNSQNFYRSVLEELELKVTIISGEEEAYYSTLGLVEFGSRVEGNVVVDIGGASTEVTLFDRNPFKICESISIPIGSVKLKYLLSKNEDALEKALSSVDLKHYQGQRIIGISGTMTSLAGIKLNLKNFDEDAVNDLVVSINDIKKIKEDLGIMSSHEIENKYPFLGKRAEVIAYGSKIMLKIMELLGAKEVVTSTKGLVHGSILSFKE